MSKINNNQLGLIGETAVMLELLKRGYDVININSSYKNYHKADLICMNPANGNSVMIQVKTGTTKNILTGFVSELDGTIPNIKDCIIGPWVFVKTNTNFSDFEFYVLSKEEVFELITSSNKWYVTEWNRELKSKPIVGVDVAWLDGVGVSKAEAHLKIQHREYKNPLKCSSKDKWEIIDNLLL